ncbi:MAG TPA: ABC transporter ATP-binding protein [Acidimicrobiales bacterium]|nr:ABC transporter ATP-binding protein [Acidimicrobiales bacterium]
MSLLEVTGIVKRFAGITALNGIGLDVEPAEIVGLIGPNGAGKTTLFNCLCGLLHPDGGKVAFDGVDITGLPVHRRARLGIGRTFQRMELFPGMTVLDHLLVADRARRGEGGLIADLSLQGRARPDELERARATLAQVGLEGDGDRYVEAMTLGRGRLVELARALMTQPRLLFLDEPSSGLDRDETARMTDVLEQLREERGLGILLVEHDVEMVDRVTSRVYVLDQGTLIASGPTAEVFADARVREAYLGDLV